jgi:5-hydroxyisourate hydrolase-like protein (transthyretin family)
MKTLSAAAACLFLTGLAFGECVTVKASRTTAFQSPSQNVRITALLDGKPVKDVRIEVLAVANDPRYSLATNEHGVAALPLLSPGRYHVVATAPAKLLGELYLAEVYLDVPGHVVNHPSLLAMDLVSASQFWPLEAPAVENSGEAAYKLPAISPMQVFQGVVVDPIGAAMAGVTIRVAPQEDSGESHAVEIKTDEGGRFSASLLPGTYTALVKMQGFRTQKVAFEIAPRADAKDLRFSLEIGWC